MIISKIEALPIRIPFRSGTRSDDSAWGDKNLAAADSLLVRVTTDQGIEGWGEAFGFRAVRSVKLAVDELIAPLCVGKDAGQIGPVMHDVYRKLQVFGRSGPLSYGISAVDIALWDIAGKVANLPLYRLLGGAGIDVPCYASLVRYSEPSLVRAGVMEAIGAGFRALKIHEMDLHAIRAAREACGSEVELMVDVNCAWTLNEALDIAAPLEELKLKWLEEPLWPPENWGGLAQLRAHCHIPVAAGENVSTLIDFDRMLAMEAVDYVQPSPAKMGGISVLREVFPIAAVRNVPVMPHSFYDGPGLLAAIHATAALGTKDSMIEWRAFNLEAHWYGDTFGPQAGRIPVPQGPGLGLEPDMNVIRDYRLPDG
ncbi:mandelate racemase/muconate lactonizing enzyme family protein [Dyella halodurans]|uniref:Mandelate racemase/muconate lactonizing enzyme family protein n=1 Tax=Dyella halodurans TaxID=1920171 RepID=A0ABV9C282_9GAMM|nr:mandelate racemase/muconate lactonizing enzyme family protein [Dyella halodurans]